MIKKRKEPGTDEILKVVIDGVQEKKAKQVTVIDLRENEGSICDVFVICHGDSNTQVDAITDSVVRFVKEKLHISTHHLEGLENLQWVLVDFGSVVVHVFQKKYRDFYQLEELWSDSKITRIEDIS